MRRGEVNRNGEILLTRKQRLYIAGVRKGMSRRQAALLAGYSQSSANNPGWNIERRGRGGKPIMRYFWDLLTAASGRNRSPSRAAPWDSLRPCSFPQTGSLEESVARQAQRVGEKTAGGVAIKPIAEASGR